MPRVLTKDIFYHYGDSLSGIGVQWQQASGTPHDLTGYTAELEVKDGFGGTTLLSLTDGDGLTIIGEQGTVLLDATSAKMLGGTLVEGSGDHVYDLEVRNGTATVRTLLKGRFVIDQQVTQP